MIVLAFIVVFIVGVITGVFGVTYFAQRYLDATFDEMSEWGNLMIRAHRNRECTLTLEKDGETIDELILEER